MSTKTLLIIVRFIGTIVGTIIAYIVFIFVWPMFIYEELSIKNNLDAETIIGLIVIQIIWFIALRILLGILL